MSRYGDFAVWLALLGRRAGRQRWVIATASLIALAAFVLVPQFWLAICLSWAALLAAALAPPRAAAPPRRRATGDEPQRRAPALSADVKALASALPDPCLVLSADGRVAYQNRRAQDLLGPVATGRPVSSLLRAPEISAAVASAIARRREVTVEYFERIPVSRWFEAHLAPVFEQAGTPPEAVGSNTGAMIGLVLVLHDLTKQKQVERMRVDFVANASHELRTPLASLAGFIETLQGSARDDAGARERFLDIMRAQAFRMSRLIDDLMSLSRIELDAHLRPSAPVDIGDIVSHVADSLKPLAEAEGTAIRLQRPEGPLLVSGERDELVQVFQNLIENAIKYGASGGPVDVAIGRAGPQGQRVEIAVRDHGPGIAPEHVPRLTERFYRVDEAHSREKGGTGLGLAIVKHILNRHRGTLDVASKPNEGSCFTVRLELANVTGERPPEPGIPGTKEK